MDNGFKVLEQIMRVAGERQKVISSNIANSDTPGYKAKDVKFGNFLNNELKMMKTNANHVDMSNGSSGGNYTVEETLSWGDGNNVEMSVEVAKMTENALLHNAAVKVLSSKIKMFKAAIRSRQ